MDRTLLVPPLKQVNTKPLANFWKLWGATSLSNLGDGLYQTALPLLAASLSAEPMQLAGLGIALTLPWLVFALPAGNLVDHLDRRQVMLWVTSGRGVILLLLILGIATDTLIMPLLYVAAFLLGISETLMDTALTSIVPATVDDEKLEWANSRIASAQTVTNSFIGPPLAGFLVGLGFVVTQGISVLLYLLAGLALLSIAGRYRVQVPAGKQQPILPRLSAGLRFLWSSDLLRNLTLFTASMNLFWSGWAALLVLYTLAPGPLGLDAVGYGLLLTAMAAGGLLGSLSSEWIQRKYGTRKALALDFFGTILLLGVPALSTNPIAVGAATLAAGFGASIWVVLNASIRQRATPAHLLGRVYSASRLFSWGVGPLGAGLAGVIAHFWGIQVYFAVGWLMSIILLVTFLIKVRTEVLSP